MSQQPLTSQQAEIPLSSQPLGRTASDRGHSVSDRIRPQRGSRAPLRSRTHFSSRSRRISQRHTSPGAAAALFVAGDTKPAKVTSGEFETEQRLSPLPTSLRPSSVGRLQQQLAEAAHDLRGPIHVANQLITTVFHRLQRNAKITECELRMLRLANGRLAQASTWANQILAFRRSRNEAPRCRPVAPLVWKFAAEGLLKHIADGESVRLLWIGWDRTLPKVSIDSDHLTRAIANLVCNACQASGLGSQLIIRATITDNDNSRLLLRIEDQGPGLPEHLRHWLNASPPSGTQPLSDTHAPLHGLPADSLSGMGLRISRSLIQGMGGRLTASKLPRRGTAMQIQLPLAGTRSHGKTGLQQTSSKNGVDAFAHSSRETRRARQLVKPVRRQPIALDQKQPALQNMAASRRQSDQFCDRRQKRRSASQPARWNSELKQISDEWEAMQLRLEASLRDHHTRQRTS